MRTLLLVGIAAISAFAADSAQANQATETRRVERRVIVVDNASADDAAVYRGQDDRAPTEHGYRGRWQGAWTGAWESDGRYRGTYEGVYAAGGPPPPPPHVRYDDGELDRICRRDGGVTGAVVGAAVGGLAGNRIAGRGSRLGGTLVGAGVGGVAGAAIDRAAQDRACDDYWRRSERSVRGGDYAYGYGYADGGYYGGYGNVTVIPGAPIIVEETETFYETVEVARPSARTVTRARVAPRRAAVRRAVPRCVCR